MALCYKLGARHDGAGTHSLVPASDDGDAKRASRLSTRNPESFEVHEEVDSDDWEELHIRSAARENERKARNEDDLPPHALRITASSEADAIDVRLFGRTAEARRAQLPIARALACQPAFIGFDSSRSKPTTPTALTFGGTGAT